MDLIDNKTEQTTREEVVVRPDRDQDSKDDELGEELDRRLGNEDSDVDLDDIHEQNQRIIEVLEKIHAEIRGDANPADSGSYQANTTSRKSKTRSPEDEDSDTSSGAGIDLPGGGL
ncbi:hypothetical protein GLU01_00585 [Nanohaloarchaea archaeon]|nr:hypothetical protein [Candidatus Nanohaloarchaea archaeon]